MKDTISIPSRAALDVGAGGIVVASIVQWLPPIAAVVGIVYYLLLISENRRFLQLINVVTRLRFRLPAIVPTASFRLALVEDWRQCLRWLSVQFILVATALQGALIAFPEQLQQYIPPEYQKGAVIFCLVAAVFGRLVKQGDKSDGTNKPVQS